MIYNLFYLIAALGFSSAVYLLCYTIIFGFSLTENKKKWFLAMSGWFAFHIFLFFYVNHREAILWSDATFVIISMILVEPFSFHVLFLYPVIYIGTSFFGVAASFIFSVILDIPEYELVVTGSPSTLLLIFVPLSILLFVFFYQRLKGEKPYKFILNWRQYLIFYATVISLFFMLAPLQSFSAENDFEYANIIGTSISIASITLIMVTVWQAVIFNREKQMREENSILKKYMDLQHEYYAGLIDRDEELRKFRHDFKSHIQIISNLNAENKKEELEKYLDDIIGNAKTDTIVQITGNKSVDAVIRPLLRQAEKNKIIVNINGELPENIKISTFNLCTIVSNLLKNAIEACEKIENANEKIINIETGFYNKQLFITVQNPFKGKLKIENNKIISSKKDKVNHGIGLSNVENAVNKYNGVFEINTDNEMFNIKIII